MRHRWGSAAAAACLLAGLAVGPASAVEVGEFCEPVGATATAMREGKATPVTCQSDGAKARWVLLGTTPTQPPSASGPQSTGGAAGAGATDVASGPLGSGWTLGPVVLDSSKDGLTPVDAEAVVLSAKRIRLYVEAFGTRELRSFVSSNGTTFSAEPGIRLTDAAFPSVVALGGSRFRMYFSRNDGGVQRILSATSKDGLAWTVEAGTRAEGMEASAIRLKDGRTLLAVRRDSAPTGTPGCNPKSSHVHFLVAKDGLSFAEVRRVIDSEQQAALGGRAYGVELARLKNGTLALFVDGCGPQFVASVNEKSLSIGKLQTAPSLRGVAVAKQYGTSKVGGAGGDLTHVVFGGRNRVYMGVADDARERIVTATQK